MRGILLWLHLLLGVPCALQAAEEIVFASYNLENYLGAEQAGSPLRQAKPKPEGAITTQIGIIKEIAPDILGVCEMGRPEQFEDFKHRLEEAGLPFAHFEYVQAADPDRHLALLSRFPIIEHRSQADIGFEVNGVPLKVARGFLDVTVRVNERYDLRLVGVHLKSKLPVPEGEALIRRHEAQLLRQHIEKIMAAEPETNLLVYGDFNEMRNEPALREVAGPRGSSMAMTALPAADDAGERWTHYWNEADLYSRIDYLFASPALLREVVSGKTRINRSEGWLKASDHRALFTSIIPSNRRR